MKNNIPEGWSMENKYDSVLVFKKLVHWDYAIDPPLDSYGENDTMILFVFFHPFQTDSDKLNHQNSLERIAKQKEELKTHRQDSIYRGKKGFYDWMGKYNQLKWLHELWEFTYFSNCSITFGYFHLRDSFKYYDESIDKETDLIKENLINYLK